MNRLLNEDLTAIRERAEKATEGPWRVGATVSGYLEIQSKKTEFPTQDTMDFIAHSREDIPKLLAEIERLRSGLKALDKDISACLSYKMPFELIEISGYINDILYGGDGE